MLLWWGTRAQASRGITCECRPGSSEPQCSADREVPDLIRVMVSRLKTVAVRTLCF